VVLLVGKCRVGSTAIANVFEHCNIPTYYQPIKTALRFLMIGESPTVAPIPTDARTICIKETFGPFSPCESLYDPLSILLKSGVNPKSIRVVILERDPQLTLASWMKHWSNRLKPDLLLLIFAFSSFQRLTIEAVAKANAVDAHLIRHDTNLDRSRIQKLFSSLGLGEHFTDSALIDWRRVAGNMGSNDRLILPTEPAQFYTNSLHEETNRFQVNTTNGTDTCGVHRNTLMALRLFELFDSNINMLSLDKRIPDASAVG